MYNGVKMRTDFIQQNAATEMAFVAFFIAAADYYMTTYQSGRDV